MAALYGVVGWKNSGKTTLVERLVAHFSERGLAVSTVKHAHHAFDMDEKGRDSWRHREAGAREVLVASRDRWALTHELRGAAEPPLEALLARMSAVDLVLIEGFKASPHPKIEAVGAPVSDPRPLLAATDAWVRAVASDAAVPLAEDRRLPVFPRDATAEIAAFIAADLGLEL